MSKQSIKQTIDDNIYQNGQQRITGVVMNSVLNEMVDNEYAELGELALDLDEISEGGLVDLWTYGDIVANPYLIVGTQGTTLFDVGTYTFKLRTASDRTTRVYIYFADSSSTSKQITANGSLDWEIVATSAIERVVYYAGTSASDAQGHTATLAIEVYNNNALALTAKDNVAREKATANAESIVTLETNIVSMETNVSTLTNKVGQISEGGGTPKNKWIWGDKPNITSFVQIGTQGTTLFEEGTYTMSFVVTSEATGVRVYVYGANNVNPSVTPTILTPNTGQRIAIHIVATAPIERIYLSPGSTLQSTFLTTYTEIQWEEGDTATEYESPDSVPLTAKDNVARQGLSNKQDTLVAGDNIVINNNVISAIVGSSSMDAYIKEMPNLLPIDFDTLTKGGITFQVNADKSIKVFGTRTGTATQKIADVTLLKGSYWLGGQPFRSTQIKYRVVRGDSSYIDTYLDAEELLLINVTQETETISFYIVINSSVAESDNVTFRPMLTKVGTPNIDFIAYGAERTIGKLNDYVPHSPFTWNGKKLCAKGDSIVEGKAGNYINMVAQILQLGDLRNYGIGGSRMAYYGDGGSVTADMSVVATWNSMDADADIIYIHAGTNDWASQVPLGDATSTDRLEFNGALNIIMSGLRAKYPTALIIFDTILPRVDYDAPTHGGSAMNIKTSEYSKAIIDRCNDHHIVCLDMYKECGLDLAYDYTNHIYATTNDGLHPNMGGARKLARILAGFINWH